MSVLAVSISSLVVSFLIVLSEVLLPFLFPDAPLRFVSGVVIYVASFFVTNFINKSKSYKVAFLVNFMIVVYSIVIVQVFWIIRNTHFSWGKVVVVNSVLLVGYTGIGALVAMRFRVKNGKKVAGSDVLDAN